MDFNTSGIEVFLEEEFEDYQEGVGIQGVFKKKFDLDTDVNGTEEHTDNFLGNLNHPILTE